MKNTKQDLQSKFSRGCLAASLYILSTIMLLMLVSFDALSQNVFGCCFGALQVVYVLVILLIFRPFMDNRKKQGVTENDLG